MQARWQQLLDRLAALQRRERIMIMLAIFAVSYQLADMLIFDRQYQKIERLNTEIARDNSTIVSLNNELNVLSAQRQDDPNSRLREQIQQVRDDVTALQSRLQTATRELISPQDMARFLEELLVQERELTMLRLQTLDVQPLLAVNGTAEQPATRLPTLHRHGFSIEFSGGYMATLRYLEALEALPWRFFWDSVSYEVVDYPQSIVRLKLHTLSLSEDWIGV